MTDDDETTPDPFLLPNNPYWITWDGFTYATGIYVRGLGFMTTVKDEPVIVPIESCVAATMQTYVFVRDALAMLPDDLPESPSPESRVAEAVKRIREIPEADRSPYVNPIGPPLLFADLDDVPDGLNPLATQLLGGPVAGALMARPEPEKRALEAVPDE